MDPSVFIPTPDAIPVHWGWFKFFLILTFMGHLLLVNAMIGSGFITFFYSLAGKKNENNGISAMQKDISLKLTFIIAFAINFGVAPFLFLQVLYGHFIYVSSQLMAVYWLSVIGLLIIAYYTAYYYKFNFDRVVNNSSEIGIQKSAFIIGVTVLIFLFIGFLFTNNMTLMLTPQRWISYFSNPNGTFLNLTEPTLLPRFLHFMTGSVAIGGLFIAMTWYFKQKKGIPGAKENIKRGIEWFLHATMVQIVIGFWFQMSLPKEIIHLFLGGSQPHTTLFLISMGMVIIVLFFGVKEKLFLMAGSTIILVFLMIMMRDMVRTAYLQPYFNLSQLDVFHQYSPLILFLVSLIIGLGVVIYMIRLAIKANQKESLSVE